MAPAVAAIISGVIQIGSLIGKSAASNASQRKAVDAQNTINTAKNKYELETQAINDQYRAKALEERKRAFGVQQGFDKINLAMKQEDLDTKKTRQDAAMRDSLFTGMREQAAGALKRYDRNIFLNR